MAARPTRKSWSSPLLNSGCWKRFPTSVCSTLRSFIKPKSAARNLDQIRTSVCYGNFNVMIAGAHGGVSVGPDGATHQALEDLFATCGLPNMSVVVPCDSVETRKATTYLLLRHEGPKYIRFAREATPIVTTENTPFIFGHSNVSRFRGEAENFIDAFE